MVSKAITKIRFLKFININTAKVIVPNYKLVLAYKYLSQISEKLVT
jgi:hypothetical protein